MCGYVPTVYWKVTRSMKKQYSQNSKNEYTHHELDGAFLDLDWMPGLPVYKNSFIFMKPKLKAIILEE
jgi:hypothetical protein